MLAHTIMVVTVFAKFLLFKLSHRFEGHHQVDPTPFLPMFGHA